MHQIWANIEWSLGLGETLLTSSIICDERGHNLSFHMMYKNVHFDEMLSELLLTQSH